MPIQQHAEFVVRDVRRAQRLLMLELGDREDFDDPRLDYSRLFSELLGTFILVLVAVVAPGLMVLGIILSMGAVSAAHQPTAKSDTSSRDGLAARRSRARTPDETSARCRLK